MSTSNVLIMGAAGRDFHNFNVFYRDRADRRVVAFTAHQIPNIAGRTYPPELAGSLYPQGIPVHSESELESLVRLHGVHQVVFAYSDTSHSYVMHQASRVLATGADFVLMGPQSTMLTAQVPVVAICAVRTGSGKSQTTRRVASILRNAGRRVVVVRHPMPYGDLARQACQRFAALDDLLHHDCTIEEREEYEPHLEMGSIVYAGVDYGRILSAAQAEADVILWDGGNNDLPFYHPDLHIVVADPHRPGHEVAYHPGEANLRMADVVVINKVDTADRSSVEQVRRNVAALNPGATVIEAASPITVQEPERVYGRRVLVIEDGPTLSHGEMSFGAGMVAAQRLGAAEIVDPRPYAVGSIAQVYRDYPHMGPILPAMGYGDAQVRELEATIAATPCDLVLVATPIDLARLVSAPRPLLRVTYELEELGSTRLDHVLAPLLDGQAPDGA